MLSRQFDTIGLDLSLIDDWETNVTSTGRADQFRGMLYIGDAAIDRDSQGRMSVPKQGFVTSSGVKTTLGFGSGYASHPTVVTLFAFTNEYVEPDNVRPLTTLLDRYMNVSEELVIGDDKYLLSPVPTMDTTKGPSTPESTREIK